MSKSLLKVMAPTFGGIALTLGSAYVLADQFVTDLPAPARGAFAVSAAQAETVAPADESESSPVKVAETTAGGESATPSRDGGFGLGRAATDEEVAAWDIDIRPDGQGLPEGEGDVWTGEELYVAQCATCHGDFGEGSGRWPQLALGMGTLQSDDPVKTVGSYWPYLSTVWDYVHRAMPFGNAQSLSDDEVYAITAYILYLNELVEDDFVLSSESFAGVDMPNADAFYMDDRPETELAAFSGEVCMTDCKDEVEITARARVLDVTPEGEDGAADATLAEMPKDDRAEADTAGEVQTAEADTAGTEPETPVDAQPAKADAASDGETGDKPAPAGEDVAAIDPALVEDGAKVFRKCQACHQLGEGAENRVGPQLNGLLGRTVGGVEGFGYSKAFQEAAGAGTVWTEEHLAEFLADPRGTYSGTKMSFGGLRKEADIAAVTAYIEAEGAE